MCGDNVCGDDGCGGSCGTCGEETVCKAGLCLDAEAPWPDVISQKDGAGEPSCPDGYYYSSGNCIPQLTEEKSGGCSAGSNSNTTPIVLLMLLALAILAARRRLLA